MIYSVLPSWDAFSRSFMPFCSKELVLPKRVKSQPVRPFQQSDHCFNGPDVGVPMSGMFGALRVAPQMAMSQNLTKPW